MRILSKIVMSVLLIAGIACSEDLPECPSKMCVMAGGWQLTEAYIDDMPGDEDLRQYRLILHQPVPQTDAVANFNRTQISGNTDTGTWSIVNNGTILRLTPGNDAQFTEDWVIESFTPRKLVLVIHRDTTIKQGPGKVTFVLEPF